MALNKSFRVKDSLYVGTSGFFAGAGVSIDTSGQILSAGTDLLDIFQDTNLADLTDGACIANFTYDGDDEWDDGEIYDPKSGNTYRGTINMVSKNRLNLRGYVGISWFGRTSHWEKKIK